MRVSKQTIGTQPIPLAYASQHNKIFMVKNKSAANIIYIQFGATPGNSSDAWPLGAGETFTLDPAAPADTIWLWSDVNNIDNVVMLG